MHFFGIILVVYILSDQGQNYVVFFQLCIKRREKSKACDLTLYQEMLIFSLLKDTIIG